LTYRNGKGHGTIDCRAGSADLRLKATADGDDNGVRGTRGAAQTCEPKRPPMTAPSRS
jgi:hypothetical protein